MKLSRSMKEKMKSKLLDLSCGLSSADGNTYINLTLKWYEKTRIQSSLGSWCFQLSALHPQDKIGQAPEHALSRDHTLHNCMTVGVRKNSLFLV